MLHFTDPSLRHRLRMGAACGGFEPEASHPRGVAKNLRTDARRARRCVDLWGRTFMSRSYTADSAADCRRRHSEGLGSLHPSISGRACGNDRQIHQHDCSPLKGKVSVYRSPRDDCRVMCEVPCSESDDDSNEDTEAVCCPSCGADIERADPPPLPFYLCPECGDEIWSI